MASVITAATPTRPVLIIPRNPLAETLPAEIRASQQAAEHQAAEEALRIALTKPPFDTPDFERLMGLLGRMSLWYYPVGRLFTALNVLLFDVVFDPSVLSRNPTIWHDAAHAFTAFGTFAVGRALMKEELDLVLPWERVWEFYEACRFGSGDDELKARTVGHCLKDLLNKASRYFPAGSLMAIWRRFQGVVFSQAHVFTDPLEILAAIAPVTGLLRPDVCADDMQAASEIMTLVASRRQTNSCVEMASWISQLAAVTVGRTYKPPAAAIAPNHAALWSPEAWQPIASEYAAGLANVERACEEKHLMERHHALPRLSMTQYLLDTLMYAVGSEPFERWDALQRLVASTEQKGEDPTLEPFAAALFASVVGAMSRRWMHQLKATSEVDPAYRLTLEHRHGLCLMVLPTLIRDALESSAHSPAALLEVARMSPTADVAKLILDSVTQVLTSPDAGDDQVCAAIDVVYFVFPTLVASEGDVPQCTLRDAPSDVADWVNVDPASLGFPAITAAWCKPARAEAIAKLPILASTLARGYPGSSEKRSRQLSGALASLGEAMSFMRLQWSEATAGMDVNTFATLLFDGMLDDWSNHREAFTFQEAGLNFSRRQHVMHARSSVTGELFLAFPTSALIEVLNHAESRILMELNIDQAGAFAYTLCELAFGVSEFIGFRNKFPGTEPSPDAQKLKKKCTTMLQTLVKKYNDAVKERHGTEVAWFAHAITGFLFGLTATAGEAIVSNDVLQSMVTAVRAALRQSITKANVRFDSILIGSITIILRAILTALTSVANTEEIVEGKQTTTGFQRRKDLSLTYDIPSKAALTLAAGVYTSMCELAVYCVSEEKNPGGVSKDSLHLAANILVPAIAESKALFPSTHSHTAAPKAGVHHRSHWWVSFNPVYFESPVMSEVSQGIPAAFHPNAMFQWCHERIWVPAVSGKKGAAETTIAPVDASEEFALGMTCLDAAFLALGAHLSDSPPSAPHLGNLNAQMQLENELDSRRTMMCGLDITWDVLELMTQHAAALAAVPNATVNAMFTQVLHLYQYAMSLVPVSLGGVMMKEAAHPELLRWGASSGGGYHRPSVLGAIMHAIKSDPVPWEKRPVERLIALLMTAKSCCSDEIADDSFDAVDYLVTVGAHPQAAVEEARGALLSELVAKGLHMRGLDRAVMDAATLHICNIMDPTAGGTAPRHVDVNVQEDAATAVIRDDAKPAAAGGSMLTKNYVATAIGTVISWWLMGAPENALKRARYGTYDPKQKSVVLEAIDRQSASWTYPVADTAYTTVVSTMIRLCLQEPDTNKLCVLSTILQLTSNFFEEVEVSGWQAYLRDHGGVDSTALPWMNTVDIEGQMWAAAVYGPKRDHVYYFPADSSTFLALHADRSMPVTLHRTKAVAKALFGVDSLEGLTAKNAMSVLDGPIQRYLLLGAEDFSSQRFLDHIAVLAVHCLDHWAHVGAPSDGVNEMLRRSAVQFVAVQRHSAAGRIPTAQAAMQVSITLLSKAQHFAMCLAPSPSKVELQKAFVMVLQRYISFATNSIAASGDLAEPLLSMEHLSLLVSWLEPEISCGLFQWWLGCTSEVLQATFPVNMTPGDVADMVDDEAGAATGGGADLNRWLRLFKLFELPFLTREYHDAMKAFISKIFALPTAQLRASAGRLMLSWVQTLRDRIYDTPWADDSVSSTGEPTASFYVPILPAPPQDNQYPPHAAASVSREGHFILSMLSSSLQGKAALTSQDGSLNHARLLLYLCGHHKFSSALSNPAEADAVIQLLVELSKVTVTEAQTDITETTISHGICMAFYASQKSRGAATVPTLLARDVLQAIQQRELPSDSARRQRLTTLISLTDAVNNLLAMFPTAVAIVLVTNIVTALKPSLVSEHPDVRNTAMVSVATLVRSLPLSHITKMVEALTEDTKIPTAAGASSEASTAAWWQEKGENAVLLSVICLAFPETVPKFVPLALIRVVKLILFSESGDQQQNAATRRLRTQTAAALRPALIMWYTAHQQKWKGFHKKMFSKAQIDTLTPFFKGGSYYV